MTIRTDSIGRPIGPLVTNYKWKDVILYALAVGAGYPELTYCHEDHLKVLPVFPAAATFDLFWAVCSEAGVDPAGVLHGEQELFFTNAIPTEGTLTATGRITGGDNDITHISLSPLSVSGIRSREYITGHIFPAREGYRSCRILRPARGGGKR